LTIHLISDIFNIKEEKNWSVLGIYPDKKLQTNKKREMRFNKNPEVSNKK